MIHPIPSGTRDVLPDEMRELRALTDRCAELDLRLRAQSAGVEVTAFLATLASHYRLTGKFKQS